MTDSKCPPPPGEPAKQPHAPCCEPPCNCGALVETHCPALSDPEPCPPPCTCPPGSTSDKSCLEKKIDDQTDAITNGEKSKAFKAELEGLLTKAQAAALEYTKAKYESLLKQWEEQDRDIAELIRKLVCALPCWRCVIECHICPLLNVMTDAGRRLFDNKDPDPKVRNLHELLFCQTHDKAAKERRFLRIKAVLAAWEKPAQTIEKALADDAKLIADIGKALGTEPSKVLFDLFFKLIPMHLAIAPPASTRVTKILKQYTQFCRCDNGCPDDCCGPDVGEPSLRQRFIGPQPYLIDPNCYFNVICCLVEKRYQPAKDQLSRAEAAVARTQTLIKRYTDAIENGLKNFEKDARAAVPAAIDCCRHYKPAVPDGPSSEPSSEQSSEPSSESEMTPDGEDHHA